MKNKVLYFLAIVFAYLSISVSSANDKVDINELPFLINVNKHAWFASLEVLSFAPVEIVEPFSGVVSTQWYSSEADLERFKITVYIKEALLTASTVDVKVYKKVKVSGQWKDVKAPKELEERIELAILTTARSLRREEFISSR